MWCLYYSMYQLYKRCKAGYYVQSCIVFTIHKWTCFRIYQQIRGKTDKKQKQKQQQQQQQQQPKNKNKHTQKSRQNFLSVWHWGAQHSCHLIASSCLFLLQLGITTEIILIFELIVSVEYWWRVCLELGYCMLTSIFFCSFQFDFMWGIFIQWFPNLQPTRLVGC